MSLDLTKFKEFVFGNLIDKPYKAFAYTKDDLVEVKPDCEFSIRYITRTAEDNGCELLVDKRDLENIEEPNAITVGDTTATVFYQEKEFICGDHMVVIRAPWMNKYLALYIVAILNNEKYKYSYGRAFLKDRISETIIKLPYKKKSDGTPFIDDTFKYNSEGFVPDFCLMEDYIKKLYCRPIMTSNVSKNTCLNTSLWMEFKLSDLFVLKGGFYNKKPEHSSATGNIPFLASTESNNGVTEYYTLEDIYSWNKTGSPDDTLDNKLFDGNCIAVTVNGSVCNAFYQTERFTCSHDITSLYLKNCTLDVYVAQFLCTIIMNEKYRWSYGRKPHDIKKFGSSIIKLPVLLDDNNNPIIDSKKRYSKNGYIPDFDFMRDYIHNLPYGDKIEIS
ncbi:MAG: restriction endonuclease subunit S [Bacilli bacterium]|nr:restriction endonuclease subunit S [Bacilli bacterium]